MVVFTATGAICADEYLRGANQPDVLIYALAYGLGGGCHGGRRRRAHLGRTFRSGGTIGLWVTRRLGWLHSLLYFVAQLLGGLAAAYVLIAVLPDTGWRFDALRWITPETMTDFSRWNAMLLEGVLTFIVVFVYFAALVDREGTSSLRTNGFIGGLAIGLTVAIDSVAAPFTGACESRRQLVCGVMHHWQNHGVYWVGPLFGGALAGVVYNAIFLPDRPRP